MVEKSTHYLIFGHGRQIPEDDIPAREACKFVYDPNINNYVTQEEFTESRKPKPISTEGSIAMNPKPKVIRNQGSIGFNGRK